MIIIIFFFSIIIYIGHDTQICPVPSCWKSVRDTVKETLSVSLKTVPCLWRAAVRFVLCRPQQNGRSLVSINVNTDQTRRPHTHTPTHRVAKSDSGNVFRSATSDRSGVATPRASALNGRLVRPTAETDARPSTLPRTRRHINSVTMRIRQSPKANEFVQDCRY